MNYPGIPSSYSRSVSIILAHSSATLILAGIMMTLEPVLRVWDFVGYGFAVITMAWLIVGYALLIYALLPHTQSRSEGKPADQTPRGPGVWDRQLDG
jgi:hypothetical protein